MSEVETLVRYSATLSEATCQMQEVAADLRQKKIEPREAETAIDRLADEAFDVLEAIDKRIAQCAPTNMTEAAILAAFAWRLQNENGPPGPASSLPPDTGIHDEALHHVLTNLARYLAQASDSNISDLVQHWRVPLEAESASTTR